MLNQEEQGFMEFWEKNRLRQKRVFKQLAVGLPLSVVLVIAIFVNFLSGWYKRAEMMINTDPSVILVLIIAAILIVVFISIFSVQHRWEMNEQRYKELVAKKNRPND